MTDSEEMVDERVVDAMRRLRREAEDAEYEQSTPGAGRWRERTASPCRDLGQPATSLSTRGDRGASNSVDRLAQRHRFGRALDLPPAEPRDGIERGIIWAAVVGIALWGIVAAILWWLT